AVSRVGQEVEGCRGQRVGVAGAEDRAEAAAVEDLLERREIAGQDRGACGHRLDQDDAEALTAGVRGDVEGRAGEQVGLRGVVDRAEELDRSPVRRRQATPGLRGVARARDEDPDARAFGEQPRYGGQQYPQSLARL